MSLGSTGVIQNVPLNVTRSDDESCEIGISSEGGYEFAVDKEEIDKDLAESNCGQHPLVGQKLGRHQLHPFSTDAVLPEGPTASCSSEVMTNVEDLSCAEEVVEMESSVFVIDDGSLSDTALPFFPVVSTKPGRHQIHPFSTSNTISSTGSKSAIDVCEDQLATQNKRGTLSRVIKGLKSPSKFGQDEKPEKDIYEKSAKQKDVPLHQEGTNSKTVGVIGKMLSKVNNVSKESKSNISHVIHRLSDVIIGGFKTDKKGDLDKSDIGMKMTSKAKSASLGRKSSDITSNYSKENMSHENEKQYEGKSKTLTNKSDHCLTEPDITDSKCKKDLPESKLFKRLSNISTHLRSKTPSDGVGETLDHSDNSNTKLDSNNAQQQIG